MDKDIQALHRFLQDGLCCTQALVAMGLRCSGKKDPELLAASKSLCLGVRGGLTCGALSGGALALSLMDPDLAAAEMVPGLTGWFVQYAGETYGGTDCAGILGGDPVNKALRCPVLVEEVWKKTRELLEDEGFEIDSCFE